MVQMEFLYGRHKPNRLEQLLLYIYIYMCASASKSACEEGLENYSFIAKNRHLIVAFWGVKRVQRHNRITRNQFYVVRILLLLLLTFVASLLIRYSQVCHFHSSILYISTDCLPVPVRLSVCSSVHSSHLFVCVFVFNFS